MKGDFFFKEKKLQETNIHCPIFCDVLALSKIPPFSCLQLLGSWSRTLHTHTATQNSISFLSGGPVYWASLSLRNERGDAVFCCVAEKRQVLSSGGRAKDYLFLRAEGKSLFPRVHFCVSTYIYFLQINS